MSQIHKLLGCFAWAASSSFCSHIASEVVEAEDARRKFCLILMPNTTPIVISPCLIFLKFNGSNSYTLRLCMGYFLYCSLIALEDVEARVARRKFCLILMPNTTPIVISPCLIFLKFNGSNSYTLRLCMGYFLYCSLIASEVVEAGVARRKFCLGCFFFFYHCIVFLHSSRLLRSLDTR